MEPEELDLSGIPALVYGQPSKRVYLFVHGKHGYKEEAASFASIACPQGWQVLSIDLPGHGQRAAQAELFVPWHTVPELKGVINYARTRWDSVALRANSIGAWFSMLAFGDEPLQNCLFVSPLLDMERLIDNMMTWAGVTQAELKEKRLIETDFGESLSWEYYLYAKANPISRWQSKTEILYGGGDNLTGRATLDAFCGRFMCGATIMPDGEHWFHTDEQLRVLDDWTRANL